MATPSDRLTHSEHSLPDVSADNIEHNLPVTPPMPHYKGDNYYNYPTQAPELNSSTTNINMQPNPMYQDFQSGPPQRRSSENQVIVEKIKEGNPDAQSPSSNLVNNVKIYERLDSILPGKLSLTPRYSYNPQKKTERDSVYQYLGSIRSDNNQTLDGLPVSLPDSKSNYIARVCLQIFFSIVLIITLFIAVSALVIAMLSLSTSNAQISSSQEIALILEELTPLINANSTYKLLVQNITNTQNSLSSFRNETLQNFSVLFNTPNNCYERSTECLVEKHTTSCSTIPLTFDNSTERLTGLSCVTTNMNGEAQIVLDDNSRYYCYCSITISQEIVWMCKISLWVCLL